MTGRVVRYDYISSAMVNKLSFFSQKMKKWKILSTQSLG